MKPTHKLTHYYRYFRNHQRDVINEGGGAITVYPTGRTELSYGSAPYGEHAISALLSAKHHINFLKQLKNKG